MKKCLILLAISLPLCAQTAPAPSPSAAAVATSAAGSSVQFKEADGFPSALKAPRPIWRGGGPTGDIARGMPKGATIPMLPSAEKIFKARQSKNDPEANCLPTGVPRIAPFPWRIVQTSTHVFFLFEGNIHSYRQIFVDGCKHKDDPDPTWYGDSIGHYEGDTLVVDTIGYNDKFWFDFAGHPHTEQLHTIERFTRKDLGTLQVTTTIIDPGAYSKPFDITFTATLLPKDELMEYICQENQQDAQHLVGFTGLN